jgi:hypothetical protein
MSYGPGWIILGALVGAAGAIVAQIVNNWFTKGREHARLKIESFERFRREFTEDENLRRIDHKKEPLTDEEIDDYIGFFEEVGLYYDRDLVDVDLVDEIMGNSITDAYDDQHIRESIYKTRAAERDNTYFIYFEQLAQELLRRKRERTK